MTEEEVVAPANGNSNNINSVDAAELDQCIIRQMEYYFGDMNLPKDKFLKEQIGLDDGWVPYTTMLKFKRLAALTTDTSVITAALKKSNNNLIEISEDGEKIRRSPALALPELNEERRKELMARTVYVKGLPKEGTTLDECLKFFERFNKPENVFMRRYLDKVTKTHLFKGSLFITFRSRDDAEKFLNETTKYKDVELIKKWQSKYYDEKQIENETRYNKALEKKKARLQKVQADEKNKIVLPRGTVLILDDVPEEFNRDIIKEAITKFEGEVGFIKIEDKKAWIRLQKEGSAKEVYAKFTDGKITISDIELVCNLPEEEIENQFLDEMASELMKRKQKQSKPKGGGNRFNRKRKGGNEGGGSHAKRRA